jgi:hypothetical protein
MSRRACAGVLGATLALVSGAALGCGEARSGARAAAGSDGARAAAGSDGARAAAGSDGARAAAIDWSRTRPFGVGSRFSPVAAGRLVRSAASVAGMRCGRAGDRPYGVHLELFAAGRGVRIPAGIGLAPPLQRRGPLVAAGRCAYPLRTLDPTGVVQVDAGSGPPPTARALFALWGQPLGPRRLAGFRAASGRRVTAFIDGRPWPGDPRVLPLRRHAAVVLEIGPPVSPHPSYVFAPGL